MALDRKHRFDLILKLVPLSQSSGSLENVCKILPLTVFPIGACGGSVLHSVGSKPSTQAGAPEKLTVVRMAPGISELGHSLIVSLLLPPWQLPELHFGNSASWM